jgi:putative ABC transport system permease protein
MLCRLYWWRLRTQPVQEALAVAGIAAGVALIFAVEIANTSVPASVRDLVHGIAGPASLEVAARTPEGFDERLMSRVGDAPGVFGVSGILDARVTVIGPRGQRALTLFGAEAGISAIGGPIARQFPRRALESTAPAGAQIFGLVDRLHSAHVDTVALPEGAARGLGASPGQLLLVDVGGRQVVVLCGGILSAQQFGAAAQSPVMVAQLAAAQRITGLAHRLTRILVQPERGQEVTVRRALTTLVGGTLNVRDSDSEVTLLERATRSSNQAAVAFTALSVVVGLLFAYNAMLLTLSARRRWISRLRDMGAYRHELISLVAFEVLVLAVAASLVGLALGDLLSRAVFGGVPRYLVAGFPIGTERVITPVALIVAVGGGVLATVVAAAGPAIGLLRGRPLEQASESGHESLSLGRLSGPVGLAAGIAAIIATVAVVLLVPGSGLVGVGALAVGLGFVLAPAVPWLLERGERLATRLGSVPGYIATVELRVAPTRATALAATSAIAVYAIVALGGAANDIRRGAANASQNIAGDAGVLVAPAPFEDEPFPVESFPPASTIVRLRSVKAVSHVSALMGSFLDVGQRRLLVLAMPRSESAPVFRSQIVKGSVAKAATLNGTGWAALSSTVASEWHLHLGAPFVLPTPSGDVRFRLAVTISNFGWPSGALIVSASDYTRLWHTEDATFLRVAFQKGITEDQGVRYVRAALSGTGLTAGTTRGAEAVIRSVTNQGLSQLSDISVLVLAAAILAVVATMAGSIWQRRPRLANLKRLGAHRAELVRTIYLETGVVVVIGCVIGAVFGLCGQPLATAYVQQSTGFPEIFSPAVWLSVRTLAVAVVLAMLAVGLLGYIVTRRSVVWGSNES